MKTYYAFISGQVFGPMPANELKNLPGFSRGTMVYPEDLVDGTSADWKPCFQLQDFSGVPFTPLEAPNFKPTPARAQQSTTVTKISAVTGTATAPARSSESDVEKIKLMDHIRSLEDQLQKIKGQNMEVDNLKIQLKERDQQIWELTTELKRYKNLPVPETQTVSAAPAQSVPAPMENIYTQIDIPVTKILIYLAGALIVAGGIWLMVPGSRARYLVTKIVYREPAQTSKTESVSEVPAAAQTVTIPVPEKSKPAATKPETPKTPALPGVPAEKPASPKSAGRDELEKSILVQHKRRVLAERKVKSYEDKGVSARDPDWLAYIEAQKDFQIEEQLFKELGVKYIDIYGMPAWTTLSDRAKKMVIKAEEN